MRSAARFELLLAAGSLALALLLGGATGHYPASLLVLTLLYACRHVYHLLRLTYRLARHHRFNAPYPRGAWGEVYQAIAQYQQRTRKRKKRQVRFASRFREAALSVPDALVIMDKNQTVEWANPAAASLLNIQWPRDDGKNLTGLVQQPGLDDIIEAADYARPIDFSPNHNRALRLTLRVTPFGEKKRQRLLVGRDITKIHALNTIRRDFVANASHELRTPLTVIMGFVENLLHNAATPAAHRRPLNLMQSQALRMRTIIDDLLTLSRLEMDDKPDVVQPVDVPEVIRSVLHEAASIAAGKYRIESDIDEELFVLGNEKELHSAFSNLVLNALKHTPERTRISVRWAEHPQGLHFTVQDTGGGIAAEHLPRLTERFYRVDKARSRASGGTGLGLAIVKHVLNRHEAELLISSRIGHGSTFVCRFPDELALSRRQLRHADGAPTASPSVTEGKPHRTAAAR